MVIFLKFEIGIVTARSGDGGILCFKMFASSQKWNEYRIVYGKLFNFRRVQKTKCSYFATLQFKCDTVSINAF